MHSSMDSASYIYFSTYSFLMVLGLNLGCWACRVNTWPLCYCLSMSFSSLPFLCLLHTRSYTSLSPFSEWLFEVSVGMGLSAAKEKEKEGEAPPWVPSCFCSVSFYQESPKHTKLEGTKAHVSLGCSKMWPDSFQRISFESFEHFYGAGTEQVYPLNG